MLFFVDPFAKKMSPYKFTSNHKVSSGLWQKLAVSQQIWIYTTDLREYLLDLVVSFAIKQHICCRWCVLVAEPICTGTLQVQVVFRVFTCFVHCSFQDEAVLSVIIAKAARIPAFDVVCWV